MRLLMLSVFLCLPSCHSELKPNKAQTSESVAKAWPATIDVDIDPEKCARCGIALDKLNKAMASFFEERKSFTLSEFRSIKIANEDGKMYPLHELAAIEVAFKSK